jgi:hypothetical protein
MNLLCRQLRYRSRDQRDIEDDLLDSGFTDITPYKRDEDEDEELVPGLYDRLIHMIAVAKNDQKDTFCLRDGIGISISMFLSYTSGKDTILFSINCAIDEIQSADNINSIMAFNYQNPDDKIVLIDALCSNQLTKAKGSKHLLSALKKSCINNEVNMITLAPMPSAVDYYLHMGFNLPDDNSSLMYMLLSSTALGKHVNKNKTIKRAKKTKKMKCIKKKRTKKRNSKK